MAMIDTEDAILTISKLVIVTTSNARGHGQRKDDYDEDEPARMFSYQLSEGHLFPLLHGRFNPACFAAASNCF